MSDPVLTEIEALAGRVAVRVKADAKAAFKSAVVQFGARAVYAGLGAVAMFVVLKVL